MRHEMDKRAAAHRAAWAVGMLCVAGCADGLDTDSLAVRASSLVRTPEPNADAVFALAPPTLDGLFATTEIWDEAPAHALRTRIAGSAPPPGEPRALWSAAWDADALYVAAVVYDAPRGDDSDVPWEDDSLELYLDADDSKHDAYTDDDYQLVFRWRDESVVEAHGKPVDGITFATRTAGAVAQLEIRIPWKSLSGMAARDWRRIGFDVHLNDDDDGGARDRKWAWHANVDSGWNDPRTFGTLRLLHESFPVCTQRDSDAPLGILEAQVAPVVDAREDPSGTYGWASIGYLTANIAGDVSDLDDLSGSWKLVWDADALYLLAFVTDDVLESDSRDPWDDDSLELYIDADASGTTAYTADDFQLVFGWNDTRVREGHGKSTAGITFATATVDGGYRLEARIPWSTLSATPPALRRRIGLDVHVNDDDDGGGRDGKLSWYASEDRAWADPSRFGAGQLIRCAHRPAGATGR